MRGRHSENRLDMGVITAEQVRFLCAQSESVCLDFKRDQYCFGKRFEKDARGELLKDLLAFANAERCSPAHILVGVKEDEIGHGNVVGISSESVIDGADLVEFVNSKTNRKIPMATQVVDVDGLIVQIIIVEPCQDGRPYYLEEDFGKVLKFQVPIRRDSGTDIASPDEVVSMCGRGLPDLEIKLLSSHRVVEGGPLLSFDLISEDGCNGVNRIIKDAMRSIMLGVSLSNRSGRGLKDIKCEIEADGGTGFVLSNQPADADEDVAKFHVKYVIDPAVAVDVQLRPYECRERFATFFLRTNGSGIINWKITVLNSVKPVSATVSTEVKSIKVPLCHRCCYMFNRVWNDAKGMLGMIAFLMKTAQQHPDVDTVNWGSVFGEYIEAEWQKWYDKY